MSLVGVAQLVAREATLAEAASDGDPAFLPARFTLELERPVGLEPLGADRRVTALETGAGALERLLARLGSETAVLRTRAELLEATRATA